MRLYVLGAVPILRLVPLSTAAVLIVPLVINQTMQNLVVVFGAASVAIGFAFKDYVSSLIAGVVAVTERPYRPGDWVKIDRPVAVIVAEKPWATHYRWKGYPIDARDQFQFMSDLTVRGKEALRQFNVASAQAVAAALSGKDE